MVLYVFLIGQLLALEAFPLLTIGFHATCLKLIYVHLFIAFRYLRDFAHGLGRLHIKPVVVEVDELVAESVHVSPETSHSWQYVFVVVNVFIEE